MMKAFILFYATLISYSVVAQPKTLTNRIGMDFIRIEPGSFIVGKFQPPYPTPSDTVKSREHLLTMWMGDGRSYNTEEFANAKQMAEKDRSEGFRVEIKKPFYIGKFEVTQGQWKKVMASNPSTFQSQQVDSADSHPVENVTWDLAQEFIRRLNKLEGKKKYRLPTEFEWEYAARAGEPERDIPWKQIQETAHLGGRTTQYVGSKKPNAYGLYDMLGNVWEWVEEFYNEKIFADPVPLKKGTTHVLKGASFAGDVKNATYMTHAGGPGNGWDVGFRVVMIADEK